MHGQEFIVPACTCVVEVKYRKESFSFPLMIDVLCIVYSLSTLATSLQDFILGTHWSPTPLHNFFLYILPLLLRTLSSNEHLSCTQGLIPDKNTSNPTEKIFPNNVNLCGHLAFQTKLESGADKTSEHSSAIHIYIEILIRELCIFSVIIDHG